MITASEIKIKNRRQERGKDIAKGEITSEVMIEKNK